MELRVEDNEMLQPPWLELADFLKSTFCSCPTKPQAKIHSSSKPVKILLFSYFKALVPLQLTFILSSQGNCFYLYARPRQLLAIWLDSTSRDILSALLCNPSTAALYEVGIIFSPLSLLQNFYSSLFICNYKLHNLLIMHVKCNFNFWVQMSSHVCIFNLSRNCFPKLISCI